MFLRTVEKQVKLKWDAKSRKFYEKASKSEQNSSISKKTCFSKRVRISELMYWKLIWQFEKEGKSFYICISINYFFSLYCWIWGFWASSFCFGVFVCFVLILEYYFVLDFWRPSSLFIRVWVLGSWHVAKLSSFGPLELYSSWRGPRRDHLVGGGTACLVKNELLEYIITKSVGLRVLRQDGQCWNELCWFAYRRLRFSSHTIGLSVWGVLLKIEMIYLIWILDLSGSRGSLERSELTWSSGSV